MGTEGSAPGRHLRRATDVPSGQSRLELESRPARLYEWPSGSGNGSLEQDGPLSIGAMEKEEKTRGRSMTTDLEKESVMRTKRARRWRSVLFQRSTWAVSPVSFPTAECCASGITAA